MTDDDEIDMGEERTLQISCESDETKRDALARTFLSPEIQASASLSMLASGPFSDAGFAELVDALKAITKERKDGGIGRLEETLTAQGVVLDAIFNHLVQRAINNIGHYVETVEIYMKLALRAQSQCRATLETLGNLNRPQIRQTNIAHGPQQINNSISAEKANPPNKLVEEKPCEKWLDEGAPKDAVQIDVGVDSHLATVGEIDRTANA